MDACSPLPLPPAVDAVWRRLCVVLREACTRGVDSLGLSALSCRDAQRRALLLDAQALLRSRQGLLAASFDAALQTELARACGWLLPTPGPAGGSCPSPEQLVRSWDQLTLVDDQAMELHLAAGRLARDIDQACEWELRELQAYLGACAQPADAAAEHAPPDSAAPAPALRAEAIGHALEQALQASCDQAPLRLLLLTELGRTLVQTLRPGLDGALHALRAAGLRPLGLTVRRTPSAGGERQAAGSPPADSHADTGAAAGSGQAAAVGAISAALQQTIQQALRQAARAATGTSEASTLATGAGPPVLHNHILAQRGQLRQLAGSDHERLVIDVVAALFGQMLDDERLPGAVAQQIARLQWPVLRVALGDADFFSARQHPVRQLINRMASLGSAIDDVHSPQGRSLLAALQALVDGLLAGDCAQLARYQRHLQALQALAADHARAQPVQQQQAEAIVARQEALWRVQQHYAQTLARALADLPLPDFLRDFLSQAWSALVAQAERQSPPDSRLAQQLRELGHELALSTQPKVNAAQKQRFVARLPQLMQELHRALDRLQWPEARRQAFFAQLLPAHAAALRSPAPSTLSHNLLVAQLAQALATPVPADPGPAADRHAHPPGADDSGFSTGFSTGCGDHGDPHGDGSTMAAPHDAPHDTPSGSPPTPHSAPAPAAPDGRCARSGAHPGPMFSADDVLTLGLIDERALARAPAVLDIDLSDDLPLATASSADQAGSVPKCAALSATLSAALSAALPPRADPAPARAEGKRVAAQDEAWRELARSDSLPKLDIALDQFRTAPQTGPMAAANTGPSGAAQPPAIAAAAAASAPRARPATGLELLQTGCAYRMLLEGGWRPVMLTHVSAGGGFYLFSHGPGGQQLLSMTRRMLQRLQDEGRLRSFEQAQLLERASQRARRQLAALLQS